MKLQVLTSGRYHGSWNAEPSEGMADYENSDSSSDTLVIVSDQADSMDSTNSEERQINQDIHSNYANISNLNKDLSFARTLEEAVVNELDGFAVEKVKQTGRHPFQ